LFFDLGVTTKEEEGDLWGLQRVVVSTRKRFLKKRREFYLGRRSPTYESISPILRTPTVLWGNKSKALFQKVCPRCGICGQQRYI